MSLRPELKIDWATYEAAKYAVEHWHYSKTMPMPPVLKLGAWEAGEFIGVVLFSRGASPHLGDAYNLNNIQVCELTRIALKNHFTPVSRMIAVSVRILKIRESNLRLVVSFADPNEGHHGGIYQAAGWLYSGQTAEKFDFLGPDGKRYRDRQVTMSGKARQFGKMTKVYRVSDCTPIPLKPKHRYLMPLDKEMRKQIEPLRKPYPKKIASEAGDDRDHRNSGGAEPTRTLQKENK
ncbi:MAG TPA: protein Mom [Desulfobacterales bacterium]|nr:protein Mom [Desulfobacterales bacterium]